MKIMLFLSLFAALSFVGCALDDDVVEYSNARLSAQDDAIVVSDADTAIAGEYTSVMIENSDGSVYELSAGDDITILAEEECLFCRCRGNICECQVVLCPQ